MGGRMCGFNGHEDLFSALGEIYDAALGANPGGYKNTEFIARLRHGNAKW